jgi:anthranilate phosphoribosyltransferase
LLLGAALALEVCGIESTPRAAIARAAAALDSGAGARIVAALRAFGEGRVA